MKLVTYTITDELGIHARPAGDLVKIAKTYASTMIMTKDGKTADAKRLLAVMSLGVKQGHVITIKIEGPDEETAATVIEDFLKKTL